MHETYMNKAISLALKGEGHTAPNPNVGCILVKDEQIIGQGYHRQYGGMHAEAEALNQVGEHAKGATAYITLEPCSHWGQQPPCVDQLIQAGIKHIVFPFCDPDPRVSGKGLEKLKQAHIKITQGVGVEPAFNLIQDFLKHRKESMPLVRAKWAMSLDGKIATYTGDSRWISGEKSRKISHQLRQKSHGILVGANSLRLDNPSLNVRLNIASPSDPIPIILFGKNPVNFELNIFKRFDTLIVTTEKYPYMIPKHIKRLIVKADKQGLVCVKSLLKELAYQNIISVLIEGGGTLLSSFLQQDLIDEYHSFIAPILLGGKEAPTSFDGAGFPEVRKGSQLKMISYEKVEKDIYLQYESHRFYHWKKEQISCLQAL